VIDVINTKRLGRFKSKSSSSFGVVANEDGIFISQDRLVVHFDPITSEQKELAWTGPGIIEFDVGSGYTLVAFNDGYAFFDMESRQVSSYERKTITDITLISGEYALLGGRDSPDITVLRLERNDDAQLFAFEDTSYYYSEARVKADGSRLMLFSIYGFKIYDKNCELINELTPIPGQKWIRDQQFSKQSGNLAVIYNHKKDYDDMLSIYSGYNGELIYEGADLRSVFYAPYGISVLDATGRLQLIDPDTCEVVFDEMLDPDETFAAYCGLVVDSAFLAGKTLIGAARHEGGYLFAVSDGKTGSLYDETGQILFDFPVGGQAEAFFTKTAVVISWNGKPTAFSLKNGEKISDLEKDAHLTYIEEVGDYIVSQYITVKDNEHFGVLLNSEFQPIAKLPRLCDTWNGNLLFDYIQGVIRFSRVYTVEDLIEQALIKD
jgi:hypothetical protein